MAIDGHSEIWPVYSKAFRNWLRLTFYQRFSKTPGTDAVNAACGVLEGLACFEGRTHALHNRIAWLDGAIYYDLTDARWRAVRIGPDGWEIVDRPPILFRRYAHQDSQVEPVGMGDLREVLDYLNVREDDHLLLLSWLIAAFVPDIPHPIPEFYGEKGSGKSVGQRVLRRLIDPSRIESLAFPGDVRELVQQLSHHYAPVYDNLEALPPWISDILCRAITGEGFSKRELYTDDDDVIYSYRRVIMLNGVNVVARRPDLLDRTILIGLDRLPRTERQEERKFWERFEAARPRLLGGIFDSLSAAMRVYGSLRLSGLERMADFTRWGSAVAEARSYEAEAFLKAYASNLGVQTREAVERHIVGAAILALMQGRDEWSGSPTDLYEALEDAGEEARIFRRSTGGKVDAKGWPGAPHILSRRLNEIRSNLADLGLAIIPGRPEDRTINIRRASTEGSGNSVGGVGAVGRIQGALNLADATDATDATKETPEGEWEAVIP